MKLVIAELNPKDVYKRQPASINANVPAHTVAIEEEPLDSRISETTRTTVSYTHLRLQEI